MVGHIEDIAVAKDQQGKKLGLSIIQALDYLAEKVGCYKVSSCPRESDWLSFGRRYWIVRKRTRASMLSVGIKELGWRWLIIIRNKRSRRDGCLEFWREPIICNDSTWKTENSQDTGLLSGLGISLSIILRTVLCTILQFHMPFR